MQNPIDIRFKVIQIKQRAENGDPCGGKMCFDCPDPPCICNGNLDVCYSPNDVVTVQNANVKVMRKRRKTQLIMRPSNRAQFTLISNPAKGKLLIRTFRFPNKKNPDQTRAFIQITKSKKVIQRTIFFDSANKKIKRHCK
ncbi:hypothetical protein IC620_04725 [Hazenella sp. IB182357]|uniref:Uncharacterized protein n=2 Tax=Polycladospora coralii TaxID=2771432 RepID=A0A926N7U1_9BACL|nr:hypothetical protein [Polycladospora coralii]MBD1371661.1 hypothetical protein [Polycladospora coralii]